MISIHTKIANGYWNVCRNRSGSRIRRRRISSLFKYIVIHSINICITLIVGRLLCVPLSLSHTSLVLTSRSLTTGRPQIHRLSRRAHHLVHRHHHLALFVLLISTPVTTNRRRCLARDDPASFPEHVAIHLYEKDV